ncbi:PREDICTED: uncharacterized protein LOC105460441, partial [Wasmannia auropunctata]|uniref:uncharacterized protein LOC105460441 n=1 Tax=Wasmannia auropunctata TaxID=64793 RepID=UPI0005ED83CF
MHNVNIKKSMCVISAGNVSVRTIRNGNIHKLNIKRRSMCVISAENASDSKTIYVLTFCCICQWRLASISAIYARRSFYTIVFLLFTNVFIMANGVTEKTSSVIIVENAS